MNEVIKFERKYLKKIRVVFCKSEVSIQIMKQKLVDNRCFRSFKEVVRNWKL
jgi:hypothetical protein